MYVLLRLQIIYENFIIILVLVEWVCLEHKQSGKLSWCRKESERILIVFIRPTCYNKCWGLLSNILMIVSGNFLFSNIGCYWRYGLPNSYVFSFQDLCK
jgi:hypothetical protein